MRASELYISESELLSEINMSPSSLQKLAGAIDARAGMEFEMIVPDVGSVDDDGNLEPDYDQDESVRDIDDAVNFFHDGDYNGRREAQRLRDAMQQDFEEWVIENFDEYWNRNTFELVFEYLTNNASDRDMIEILELEGEEAEELEQNGSDKKEYLAAAEKVIEDADSSSWYDDARDEAQDDYMNDGDRQQEWLESAGLNSMMDIENTYQITWPHWHNPNEGDGEYNVDQVADDFSSAIGKPINASTSYHGARREPGHYVVEPDGSLDPDGSNDVGLEFVSPPLPINELLADLAKVKAWADSRGCYTNKSTGLHINVSVPNFSMEKLDYVKLALLLGDEYVLKEFGRSSNTYTKSALGIVKRRIAERPEDAKAMLDQMKTHLGAAASKAIHTGNTDKYTSINTKTGYIEFRSPGGDWLNANFDKIQNTLLRFTVALNAAIDPEAYREEYLKKFYKLLDPQGGESRGTSGKGSKETIKYFADYVAGNTPKAALRSFIKQAQLERRLKKGEMGGEDFWWRVSNPQHSDASIEVVARSKEEAIAKALEPSGYPSWKNTIATVVARPIRPYSDEPVRAQVGAPQPVGRASGPTVGGRASNPEGAWILARRGENPPVPLYRFGAAGVDDANTVVAQWNSEHPSQPADVHYDPQMTRGQPAIPGSTLDLQRQRAAAQTAGSQGNWGIWITGENRFSRAQGQSDNRVLRRFPSREAAEQWIEQTRATNPALRPDIEVREIEPAAQQATGGIEYIIFKISDRSQLTGFRAANQAAAEREAESILRDLGLDPDLYDVRPRHPTQQIPEVPLDIDVAPQRPPGQLGAGRELIGWRVLLPSGEEVTQIHGIGNNQGDANRIAAEWLRQNGYGVSGEGYEVVPLWREA